MVVGDAVAALGMEDAPGKRDLFTFCNPTGSRKSRNLQTSSRSHVETVFGMEGMGEGTLFAK